MLYFSQLTGFFFFQGHPFPCNSRSPPRSPDVKKSHLLWEVRGPLSGQKPSPPACFMPLIPFGAPYILGEDFTSLSTRNKSGLGQRLPSPRGAEEEAMPGRTMGALSARARETQQSNKSYMLSWWDGSNRSACSSFASPEAPARNSGIATSALRLKETHFRPLRKLSYWLELSTPSLSSPNKSQISQLP